MENKTTRRLMLAGAITFWLIAAGCAEAPFPVPAAVIQEGEVPDQESWNATIYLIDDARHRIVLQAGHRSYYRSSQETRIDNGLTVRFFDDAGVLASTLTADRGTLFEATPNMVVFGNVVIDSERRGRMEADSLRWDEATNLISTRSRVRVTTKLDEITGFGFEADPELNNWQILSDVQGTFDRGEALDDQLR